MRGAATSPDRMRLGRAVIPVTAGRTHKAGRATAPEVLAAAIRFS